MAKVEVVKKCPFCGKVTTFEVDGERYNEYMVDRNVGKHFGNLNPFEREVLITSMCFDCQEETFCRPKPGNEEAWGPYVNDCDCCGAPIYKLRNATSEDGAYKCRSCGIINRATSDGTLVGEYDEE